MNRISIIGVDCATTLQKTGLATASWDGRGLTHVQVVPLSGRSTTTETPMLLAAQIEGLVGEAEAPVVLALDAPLGWPSAMQVGLPRQAGSRVAERNPDSLFRRQTDRVVEAKLGRRLLEVGADRIARTSWVALRTLEVLRRDLGVRLPMAWSPEDAMHDGGVIEVYPVGTALTVLPAHERHRIKGYKSDPAQRSQLLSALSDIEAALSHLEVGSDHDLDAVLAIMAAGRFLRGDSPGPVAADAQRLAHAEGWIWL